MTDDELPPSAHMDASDQDTLDDWMERAELCDDWVRPIDFLFGCIVVGRC